MTKGLGGKYDHICEEVMVDTLAQTVMVCVIGGNKGSGFSVTSLEGKHTAGEGALLLADILESVARQVRADVTNG